MYPPRPQHSFRTQSSGWPDPRLEFRVLIRSSGRPGQFFYFLNQNDVVLVKNQRVATEFLTGSYRVFPFFIFSSTRSSSSSGSAGSRVSKLWYMVTFILSKTLILIKMINHINKFHLYFATYVRCVVRYFIPFLFVYFSFGT